MTDRSVDLGGRAVFLSASVPYPDRAAPGTYEPDEIVDCVVSFLRAVFAANGRLVFGGHPSINPLVLKVATMAAHPHETGPLVVLYQSGYFADRFPEEVAALAVGVAELRVVDPGPDRSASLQLMRETMLSGSERFAAAAFIGGMEGVDGEYRLFRTMQPGVPAYAFGGPGGTAAELAAHQSTGDTELDRLLATSRRYPFVADMVLAHLTGGS